MPVNKQVRKKLTDDQKVQIACAALRATALAMPEEVRADPIKVADQAMKLAVHMVARTQERVI